LVLLLSAPDLANVRGNLVGFRATMYECLLTPQQRLGSQ
jgi:hypothetical protein